MPSIIERLHTSPFERSYSGLEVTDLSYGYEWSCVAHHWCRTCNTDRERKPQRRETKFVYMLTILKLIFNGIIQTNICTGADNLGIDAHNHKVTNCNSCRPLGPYLLRCISFEKWLDQTLQGTPILDKRSDSGCLEGSGMRDQQLWRGWEPFFPPVRLCLLLRSRYK